MTDYPLTHVMPNGSSLADYLGTASTAAKVAAGLLDNVRAGDALDPIASTFTAKAHLTQAIEELDEVMVISTAAHIRAYGQAS